MVYFIADQIRDVVKIGYSKEPHRRLKQLQTSNSNILILLGYIQGTKIEESSLHKLFDKYRCLSNNEWFNLSDEIINYINKNNLMSCFVDRIDGKVYRLNKMKNI